LPGPHFSIRVSLLSLVLVASCMTVSSFITGRHCVALGRHRRS
jgi:hypothetical protein